MQIRNINVYTEGTEEKKAERNFKLSVDRTVTTVYTVYEQMNGEPVNRQLHVHDKKAQRK